MVGGEDIGQGQIMKDLKYYAKELQLYFMDKRELVIGLFVCFFFSNSFIYLFLVCWVFVVARRLSLLFIAVCGLLIVVASLVAEHGL